MYWNANEMQEYLDTGSLNSNIRCIEIADNAISDSTQQSWIVTLDVLKFLSINARIIKASVE